LPEDCKPIGDLYNREGLHRKRNPLIYQQPLLLINQACTKFLFSDFDVLFQHDFQSISAPKQEESELLFLTAVLSSPLAQYLLFHATANIGIERDVARLEEILELPFPLPEDTTDPERSQSLLQSCADQLRTLRVELQKPRNFLKREALVQIAQDELYRLVCDYFEICEWELHLIQDTVGLFRPSSTPASLSSENLLTAQPSEPTNRKEYADEFVRTFRGWSTTNRHLWAEASVSTRMGLVLMTFGIDDNARKYAESPAEDRVTHVLDSIRKTTTGNGTLFSRLRGFVFYESDRVHILKPLNRRHWTRTAALNDCDEILTRMMEENGWGD
jgi:hypothetical protein